MKIRKSFKKTQIFVWEPQEHLNFAPKNLSQQIFFRQRSHFIDKKP
jgi:hypothetical protein